MTDTSAGVVVVGAGLGAIRLAETLRTNGYTDPITLIGAEPYAPYDRPPLSKSVLLGKDDRVELKPAEFYADSNIDLQLGRRVVAIAPGERTVTVADAGDPAQTETVAYDTLVLATGLSPRPFPGADDALVGLHTLRTYDDAVALRSEIDAATDAVVIGAGFIGCEVAASLLARGVKVSLVEPAPTPLAAALGTEIGKLVTRLHIDNGIDVRAATGVSEIIGTDGRVTGVRLDDDSRLPADIVVVGIGSIPVTDYLDGSGIDCAARAEGGGIACDAYGRTSAESVYALGDVANWRDADGVGHRAEHWNHTVEQAAIVAHQIVGGDAVTPAVPYFWSDQFDLKIQVLGSPRPTDDVHIAADDGKKFLAYYSRDGILTAVAGAGKVGAVMKTRAKLVTPTPIDEVL
ncbi:FAD-dependent oxidoreductase [Gordonia sp. ABSL1-1]|uniref:NAD(P)/FAD-dependent oxidoreductase n=1 Tax=Gordonia sp. ABSL1-1 TaxID=3053923 RepID=UPI0025743F55|nr:FAD-dependent oxidoreductase [Gordonia sp. ABSL1-1]MDL9937890.1 FAD-dependent oxidoreductase [Gordonia sp. ABSL1-1]